MCACGTEIETTEYFLLRCQFYITQRLELFENLEIVEKLEKVEPNFLSLYAKNDILIFCMVLKQIPKILIKKFLKIDILP